VQLRYLKILYELPERGPMLEQKRRSVPVPPLYRTEPRQSNPGWLWVQGFFEPVRSNCWQVHECIRFEANWIEKWFLQVVRSKRSDLPPRASFASLYSWEIRPQHRTQFRCKTDLKHRVSKSRGTRKADPENAIPGEQSLGHSDHERRPSEGDDVQARNHLLGPLRQEDSHLKEWSKWEHLERSITFLDQEESKHHEWRLLDILWLQSEQHLSRVSGVIEFREQPGPLSFQSRTAAAAR
jgi:hypothetical protein